MSQCLDGAHLVSEAARASRSALEMTLAASLSIASPKSTASQQQQQPPALLPPTATAGRQAPVALLTLEAGASPRSIAASNALIASFQSDPGAHETFRPVRHTAKAAQRAAKLAHLKAARQAQRLMRPKTSPVDSPMPLRSSQQLRRHSGSKVIPATNGKGRSGPASSVEELKRSTLSAPASPITSQAGTPLQSQRSFQAIHRQDMRAQSARAHCPALPDPATDAAPSSAGSISPCPEQMEPGSYQRPGQIIRPQSLNFMTPGAFMPRQRSGLGPGPHPVHEALQRDSCAPSAARQPASSDNHALSRPLVSPTIPSSPVGGMHRANDHSNGDGTPLPSSATPHSTHRHQADRPQLAVSGSGVAQAIPAPFVAPPAANGNADDAACCPSDTASESDQQLGSAIIIGSPIRKAPGRRLLDQMADDACLP